MASHLPSSMRAAKRVGSGPLDETLAISTDVPLPKNTKSLPADHVLVRVAYTSLNPFDLKVSEAPIIGSRLFQGIPCLDFAGVVLDSNAPRFKMGELIYGQTQPLNFGACAEYVVVAEKYCMTVPNGVTLEDASTIGIAGLMAYQSIAPFVKSGDRVFINGGSGGVGTYGIQIAKAIGCYVNTTCSGTNSNFCKDLGADEVIDYRTQNIVETLKSSDKPYDLIIDNIFMDPQLYWSCHEYLKPEGRYVTIAASPTLGFLKKMLSIMLWPSALGGGQRKFQLVGRTPNTKDYERIADWIKQGTIKVVIDHTYDLEDVRAAFKKLKSGRARGKLVVKIG